ncbi:MAG TPA: divalent-cation tolerance protein CutA [Longimicrobiales bacterium]|nr:divalent-cation tolerance protein CutA [Longimicrobiales bacterium]
MSVDTGVRVVLVTAPDEKVAEDLVRALVEEGLAACGNLVPGLVSIYRWRGRIERDSEVLIVLKTTASAVPALLERVPALHPYEVPEVLVLPVEAGHGPYLAWVFGCVSTRDGEG